jgi:O-antigen/teichoic acid export membrane protein
MSLRGIGTIVFFVLVQYLWDNLLLSIAAITICSYMVILFYDRRKVKPWNGESRREKWAKVYQLLVTCIPLAIVAFLNNFSINLPKISLENNFGSEIMGYFSSVASPTAVVQMAASTIFAPLVPPLTEAFIQKDRDSFYGLLRKFAILLGVLSVLCVLGAALLGRWGLNLLFGMEIDPYVYLFTPEILVSVLVAVNASLFSICTLIREIKKQYIVGIAGIVASAVLSYMVVPKLSMNGVVLAQLGTMMIQILLQIILIAKKLKYSWRI